MLTPGWRQKFRLKKSHDTVYFREYLFSNVLQVEFNNAIKENSSQTLRHASKKVNMEKNQNPRIIPCECIPKCTLLIYEYVVNRLKT
jgi:hypothetical protein